MSTKDYAEPAWRDWGQVIVVDDIDEAYALADSFAFEHVQIFTAEPRAALEKMHDYGALFPREKHVRLVRRDKVIGTNHVLPTLGAARYTGPLGRKVPPYRHLSADRGTVLVGALGEVWRERLASSCSRDTHGRAMPARGATATAPSRGSTISRRRGRHAMTDLAGRVAVVTGGAAVWARQSPRRCTLRGPTSS